MSVMCNEIEIVPLQAEHLAHIDIQEKQRYFKEECTSAEYREAIAKQGGWVLIADGRIIAIAGIVPTDKGVGIGWAVLSTHFKKYALRVTRAIRKYLDKVVNKEKTYHRVEVHVDTTFKEAVRWAKLLGLTYESTRKKATAYRQDMQVYVILEKEE